MSEPDVLEDLDEMWEQFAAPEGKRYPPGEIAAVMLLAATEIRQLREDLDKAVGYKLATAEETKGDMDRDDG